MRTTALLFFISIVQFLNAQKLNTKAIHFFSKDLIYQPLKEDFLFISNAEISNQQYNEFLYWTLKNKGLQAYHLVLPDTNVWKNKLAFNEPYVDYYLRHPAFKDYPVVGVNYVKAEAWCNWAADRIMETEDFKKLNIEKIILRLPTQKEWQNAARGTLPDNAIWPWPGNTLRIENEKGNDEGKIRLNVKRKYTYGFSSTVSDAGFITTPVYSYWPNTIGLYNICGNVAEWVQEKKAMGGSWNSLPYSARIDFQNSVLNDSFSSSTIGFRPVLEIISYKKNLQTPPLKVDAKTISKQLGLVKDSLFASFFETSNLLYNTFLSETKCGNCAINNKNWDEYTPYKFQEQYGWHPTYDNYPVVNINYESAVKFCEWLSQKYNTSKDKKFNKVMFKLPSKVEWELAASSHQKRIPYPWGGPYYRNSKGGYLANFWPLEDVYLNNYNSKLDTLKGKNKYIDFMSQEYEYPDNNLKISMGIDGFQMTSQIDNYYPNAFGLYCMAGNVAEMIAEEGVSKGGSFNSFYNFIQIQSQENYINPNANLGFRFFMQVLEK